jgi:SAM-dependent methyltransferase
MSQHCPVCRSAKTNTFANGWDSEYGTSTEKFEYRYCKGCDTVFIKDPPVDKLSIIYPANYYSFAETGKVSLLHSVKNYLDNKRIKKLIRLTGKTKLRVLDVGGGDGWLLSVIRDCNPEVAETHEVDLDGNALQRAVAAGHIGHHCRIEDLKTDLKFDLIVMLNIIEHVADPGKILEKCHKLLSPEGFILIKTPNHKTLSRYLFKNANWGGFHCPRHWVLFSMASLTALSQQSQFEVVNAAYTQGAPQWATSVLGWLAAKGIVGSISADRPMHLHWLYNPLLGLFAGFDMIYGLFLPTSQMFFTLRRR